MVERSPCIGTAILIYNRNSPIYNRNNSFITANAKV